MANFNIYTVREMIDSAFGETNPSCPVNFKMIGTVLYILARRMELLKRHFKIELKQKLALKQRGTLILKELKIHTKGKTKSRKARTSVDRKKRNNLSSHKITPQKRFTNDSSSEMSSAENRYIKGSHKRTDNKHLQNKRIAQVFRSEQHRTQKNCDETSSSERHRARKYSDERSPAAGHRVHTEKSPASRQKTTSDESSSDSTKESHEETNTFHSSDEDDDLGDPTANLHPVATQEQYNDLLAKVRKLQSKFGISTTKTTKPKYITSTTSMTHPKAAMNISVRLDGAENKLGHLLKIVTELAGRVPETVREAFLDEIYLSETGIGPQSGPMTKLVGTGANDDQTLQTSDGPAFEFSLGGQAVVPKKEEYVKHPEFIDQLEKLHFDLMKQMKQAITNARFEKCERLLGGVCKLEMRVNIVQNHFHTISGIEYKLDECGKAAANIDQRITSQTAVFQDNLTLMQADLETALDKVSEALLSPKEDAAAVAATTETFTDYKRDLVNTKDLQNFLKQDIEKFLKELEPIRKKIEQLRIQKCSRQQMFEALGDKLSLADINGMLTQCQFGAVTASMKDILKNLQMKIFSKEVDWQFSIDNFITKCTALGDKTEFESLNNSIQKCLMIMDKDINDMLEILEPSKTYTTAKTVKRDEKCLSCGAPVEVVKDELSLKLWKEIIFTAPVPADNTKIKNQEMAKICIPGRPIPHPLEQSSFICQHDCGDIVKPAEESLVLFARQLNPDSKPNGDAVPDNDKVKVGDN